MRGCEKNELDKDGKTALDWASGHNRNFVSLYSNANRIMCNISVNIKYETFFLIEIQVEEVLIEHGAKRSNEINIDKSKTGNIKEKKSPVLSNSTSSDISNFGGTRQRRQVQKHKNEIAPPPSTTPSTTPTSTTQESSKIKEIIKTSFYVAHSHHIYLFLVLMIILMAYITLLAYYYKQKNI